MERNTARWEVTVAGWRQEEQQLGFFVVVFFSLKGRKIPFWNLKSEKSKI